MSSSLSLLHRRKYNNYRQRNNGVSPPLPLPPPPPPPRTSSWSTERLHSRYQLIFGKPHPDFVPPLPPPPNSSFNYIPQRPSKPPQPSIILPHPLFPGVYVAADNHHRDHESLFLYTRNLVPGVKSSDQNVVFSVRDDDDGGTVEYREWDPYKSRLAAAILSGAHHIWIKPGSRVLVCLSRDDAQFGITISHISDIVGPQGIVYVVEGYKSNSDCILDMADKRLNIVPIGYDCCMHPLQYRMLINIVDVLFAAPDSDLRQEVTKTYLNAIHFLKTGGHYMLYVQGNCIESTKRGDGVFSSLMIKDEQVQFQRMERVTLEPFDRDHAYVSGVFRTLEISEIDPNCPVSRKFLTSQDSHRGYERPVGSYFEKYKNVPVYMLFESSCGYVLFRARDMNKVRLHYLAAEEYIKNFDESYEFVACHTFVSSDEALMYLTATINETTQLPEKLLEFLMRHIPPTKMEGGENCYALQFFDSHRVSELVRHAKSEGSELVRNAAFVFSASIFDVDIFRGVRMNIDKFFQNMKPGDLEKAQIDLSRILLREKLNSLDKNKLPTKRGASLANFSTGQNPKRKA